MMRRLFNAGSALALLLCVVIVTIWIIANKRACEIKIGTVRWEIVAVRPGWLDIDNNPQLYEKHQVWLGQLRDFDAEVERLRDIIDSSTGAKKRKAEETLYSLFPFAGKPPQTRPRSLTIPIAIPFACVAICGVVLMMNLVRRIRRWYVREPGHCRECGYDLRASTERCPECGTPIPAEARA